jgi:site-specific recombinase XerD
MKTKFYIRKDVLFNGKNPIYLRISGDSYLPERIHLNLFVSPKDWDEKNQRILGSSNEVKDYNLILDSVFSKLADIKINFRLSQTILTPKILRAEYENKLSRVNFIAFFKAAMEEDKPNMVAGTYKRYESVYKKLHDYESFVPFNRLTLSWFQSYKNHMRDKLGNANTTINSNLAAIKKILRLAQKNGIKLIFDLDDLKSGKTDGSRTYLNATELNKCVDYYFSSFISPGNKLILGYYLFACMTGLRVSNIQALNREELLQNEVSLVVVKSKKDKLIALNAMAKKIINGCKELFVTKFADQTLNAELKLIMPKIGIHRHITMHVGRHTFATLFLKMGGKVEMLQMLLCHSSIVQTMVYVHIVQAEANNEIFLLDKVFDTKKAG